jgi:hypothetical protein
MGLLGDRMAASELPEIGPDVISSTAIEDPSVAAIANRCLSTSGLEAVGPKSALSLFRSAVLHLQNGAGNRAVAALMAPMRPSESPDSARPARRTDLRLSTVGAAVLQRDVDFGLRKKEEVSGFAVPALEFWRSNKDKTLEEFGLHLMDELNNQLDANGVPRLPPPKFGPTPHAAGGFNAKSWSVVLDLAKTAAHPLNTKIGDLAADRVAEVAGICYHEVRHAEQAFLVARLVASRAAGKKSAADIAAELDLDLSAAEAAVKSTSPLPGRAGTAEIEHWRAFEKSGKHHDYWEWNETFKGFVENTAGSLPKPSPQGVDKVTAAWEALTPTIAGWRKDTLPFADTKIKQVEKVKSPDAADKQVLGDLKKIRAAGKKVIKADKKMGDQIAKFKARQAAAAKKPITVDEARLIQAEFVVDWLELEENVLRLGQAINDAYRAYPQEADAYKAEAAVMQTFLSKAKSGSPKPRRK